MPDQSVAQGEVAGLLQDLTGKQPLFSRNVDSSIKTLLDGSGIGYSQMNELLLVLGYDRISRGFFQSLVDWTPHYVNGAAIKTMNDFRAGVDRFRRYAILRFGNIKYAFGYISELSEEDLSGELSILKPIDSKDFAKRHDALIQLEAIAGDRTYYLGYVIKDELDARLEANPGDAQAKAELAERESVVAVGKRNNEAYLASDHMDVYVATSMRERHEYQMVSRVVSEVFADDRLRQMKVRWFDPTQAYCHDRIDKGLAEGLMLKRATCTLYLVQESDSFGKDSELASTLAQGKPVIAFIPQIRAEQEGAYVEDLLALLRKGSPAADERTLALNQLRVFAPKAAWTDQRVMAWVRATDDAPLADIKMKLGRAIREHYEKRAKTLKETHPLGLQVHLETGVANGVLVARSEKECAELIWRVLTNRLEFTIKKRTVDDHCYLLLVEEITGSIFRVVSGDAFLTNAFWNYYLPRLP